MTINEFFKLYNKYCNNTENFSIFNNHEDVFNSMSNCHLAFGIFKSEDNYYIDNGCRTILFENEAVCVYHFLEKLHQTLEGKGFPKYNFLLYGNVVVGIVINLSEEQKAYLADDIVIDCKVSNLDNIQALGEEFWSSCPKEIVNNIDKWVEERY